MHCYQKLTEVGIKKKKCGKWKNLIKKYLAGKFYFLLVSLLKNISVEKFIMKEKFYYENLLRKFTNYSIFLIFFTGFVQKYFYWDFKLSIGCFFLILTYHPPKYNDLNFKFQELPFKSQKSFFINNSPIKSSPTHRIASDDTLPSLSWTLYTDLMDSPGVSNYHDIDVRIHLRKDVRTTQNLNCKTDRASLPVAAP